ncbi:kinesin-like protein KIN-14L [Tanacetum coccineum]
MNTIFLTETIIFKLEVIIRLDKKAGVITPLGALIPVLLTFDVAVEWKENGKDGKNLFAMFAAKIFADTQPLIQSVLDGYNVCIFAYGQMGIWEIHTMCASSGRSEKYMDIIYLALNDLFDMSNTRNGVLKYEW